MAELDLPDGPRQLFDAVRTPLARAFGGERYIRFGGGTALAARWAHRHSTDVDLFVDPNSYRDFRWKTGGRFTLDLTAGAPVDRLVIEDDNAHISFHGHPGHVSIAIARAFPFDPRSPDTVRGTDLPLEATAEILGKKLLYRMARDKQILSRDLYDIAYARKQDPAPLDIVLRELDEHQLSEIIVAFDDRAAAGAPDPEPVLRPSDPVLAEKAPAIVQQLVRDEFHQRGPGPDLRPGR